jgi:competence protein ComEC
MQTTPLWQEVLSVASQRRIRTLAVAAGDNLRVGHTRLAILAPDLRSSAVGENPNEESLVVCWQSGGARVLLMGDAGAPTEALLVATRASVKADLLKVGHHGSQGASSSVFLQAVAPTAAVLSCGRNNVYGHPHPPTLDRLRSVGVPVSRTDESGMVTVRIRNGHVTSEGYLRRDGRADP